MTVAAQEIMWLLIAIGALAIMYLLAGFFGENAEASAPQPEESDSEQGAFDDPHSEEYTR